MASASSMSARMPSAVSTSRACTATSAHAARRTVAGTEKNEKSVAAPACSCDGRGSRSSASASSRRKVSAPSRSTFPVSTRADELHGWASLPVYGAGGQGRVELADRSLPRRTFMTESSSSGPSPVPHDLAATSAERRASGEGARRQVPRRALGSWSEEDREHDPLKTILAQNQIRVPELVPLRHQRMAVSPWNYYRGAAAVMAADLGGQPDSGLMVQLCGDAHVLNFGLWATPERNLAFDLRDFDETLPGPFEWDVKRFAVSLVVAARQSRVSAARAAAAVTAGVEAYARRMRRYATMPELDIW